nr:reverse transcriptase domain-containing protein [Tanacetum cinerariifolium]
MAAQGGVRFARFGQKKVVNLAVVLNCEEYDEEREIEPRLSCAREVTSVLRIGSPQARRQKGKVVEFSEAPNRDGSRVERESKGRRPSKRRAEDNENHEVNLPPLLAAHLGRNMNGQPLQSTLTSLYGGHQPSNSSRGNLPSNVHNIKQREGESTRAFITRYTDDTLQILGLHEEQPISGFVHGLKIRSLVEFLSTYLPTTYKGQIEKTYNWTEAKYVATNGALNNHREGFNKYKKGSSWDNSKRRKNRDNFSPYRRPNHRLLSNSFKSTREILATKKPSIRSLRVNSKITLVSFSGEQSWPLGEIPLEITIGDRPFIRMETLNFVLIRSDSPHNLLLERSAMQNIEERRKKFKETPPEKGVLSCTDTEERIKEKKRKSPSTSYAGHYEGHNYPKLEKLILALVCIARRLGRYFQAHPIRILTDKSIEQFLARPKKLGQIAKWAIKLGEKDIKFRGRNSVKGQVLVDFLVETSYKESKEAKDKKPTTKDKEAESKNIWKIYTNRASSSDGSRTSLMLISPKGKEYTYVLRFKFETTNNEAEYKALLVGLRIAMDMKVKMLSIFVDS